MPALATRRIVASRSYTCLDDLFPHAPFHTSSTRSRPMTVYTDLLRYRELFENLFRRDLQAKYRGSVLGILWSLVNPLALMVVYLVVFGLLWTGTKIPHYPLYLLAGI